MTAEVVTMNRGAVAMAADSAITIIGRKVYNSGSKLFPLSKNHPIGIMFYGNAALMGVPWETIVAEYRSHVEETRFDRIDQFGAHFLKFVGESNLLFPSTLQKRFYLETVTLHFRTIVGEIDKNTKALLEKKGTVTPADLEQISSLVITGRALSATKEPLIDGVTDEIALSFAKSHEGEVGKILDQIFEALPLSEASRAALLGIAPNCAFRQWLFPDVKSGIVICGFGEKEIYPSLFHVQLEAVIDGKVRSFKPEVYSISDETDSYIRPFAQQDVAQSFLRGIDPTFRTLMSEYLFSLIQQFPAVLIDKLGASEELSKSINSVFKELGGEILSAIGQQLENVSRERFVNPVLDAVRVLPKDELASMAETLVSLTSFRRRMSLEVESVGGPVDVAVISKKDGFIWIKRKHYFDPRLNPNYFSSRAHEPRQD